MGLIPDIRPNYSDIRPGRSGNRARLAVPQRHLEDSNAAEQDIHVLHSVLLSSAYCVEKLAYLENI
jgi:hypothetical protein